MANQPSKSERKVQEMYIKTKNSQKHFCAIPRQPEDIAAWKQQSVQLFVLVMTEVLFAVPIKTI